MNFLIAEAKLAIYLTQRDRIWDGDMWDVAVMWKQNIRFRLRMEATQTPQTWKCSSSREDMMSCAQ